MNPEINQRLERSSALESQRGNQSAHMVLRFVPRWSTVQSGSSVPSLASCERSRSGLSQWMDAVPRTVYEQARFVYVIPWAYILMVKGG